MDKVTLTPFGRRAVTAGLLATQALASCPAPVSSFDKWELFRHLCTARAAFGVSDRDLTVLNALLSFHKPQALEDEALLVVYPSNRALSERAHGMAESTLRRHLAALVDAGLILRHDSPNGKRYARRDAAGEVDRAFGFDLRPLLCRATEIADAARAAREAAERTKRLREACVLLCRDAVKLLIYGRDAGLSANWDALDDRLRLAQRALRRKLTADDLGDLRAELETVLQDIRDAVQINKTEEMSGKDIETERHLQNSNPDSSDLEPCPEKGGAAALGDPKLPLHLVVRACPEIALYRSDPIDTWRDLIEAASFVRGMMGISPSAWEEAIRFMGAADAAIAVACILERVSEIGSPGGYLRSLTAKAADGAFSTGPMVMALLNRGSKQAA